MSPLYPPPGSGGATTIGYAAGNAAPGPDVALDELPRHYGWTNWAYDPRLATSASALTGAAALNVTKIMVPGTVTPTSAWVYLNLNGSTLTNSYVGIYSSAGTLLGTSSADQSASWASGGPVLKQITIAPGTITGGTDVFVWLAFQVGSFVTTIPNFMRRVPAFGVAAVNLNQSAAQSTSASIASANAALPASFTPSSLVQNGAQFWAALS